MVADGTLDATFIKPNSHDWDLAAADLILSRSRRPLAASRAATGRVYATANSRHGALAAGSGPLLSAMIAAIAAIDA